MIHIYHMKKFNIYIRYYKFFQNWIILFHTIDLVLKSIWWLVNIADIEAANIGAANIGITHESRWERSNF